MKKINIQLKKNSWEKRLALMTHLVVGYPSLKKTLTIAKQMAINGADFIELQIPFSDPMADGPTIMKACEKSLSNGTTVKDTFIIARKLSKEISTPLLLMAYFNTVFQYGVEKFCNDAKETGICGLIIPDIPIEEESEDHFIFLCKKYGLANIRVLSPASTESRLKKNAKIANGFVYVSARQGTTGVKESLDPGITNFLKKVRNYFSIPIAVGFGISSKEHLQILKPFCEIAVLGSAFIEIINRSKNSEVETSIKSFMQSLKI